MAWLMVDQGGEGPNSTSVNELGAAATIDYAQSSCFDLPISWTIVLDAICCFILGLLGALGQALQQEVIGLLATRSAEDRTALKV